VIRNNPAPGAPAAKARADRDAHTAARKGQGGDEAADGPESGGTTVEEAPRPAPRQQPKKQPRSKRKKSPGPSQPNKGSQ
jgi:YidC/Oxa1 family membrane protein insertase